MKKARILIVDGDPDFSQMTKQAIEQAGYESVCAINGRTGLDMAKRERPALIILEVILPDINGFSVCRELKEDPACQAIPVVLYTNLGTKTGSYAEHIGMEHGADAYVEKPAAPQALLEKVSTLLAPTRPVQGEERGRKLVLLVDADADFIAATKQMLIANKYEVMTARDGEEGLNKAMREEPDIILLDVILPGKDGYSVCYELKKNPRTRPIPVVMLTAIGPQFSRPEYAADIAIEHLSDDFIDKPVDAETLLKKIEKHLLFRAQP